MINEQKRSNYALLLSNKIPAAISAFHSVDSSARMTFTTIYEYIFSQYASNTLCRSNPNDTSCSIAFCRISSSLMATCEFCWRAELSEFASVALSLLEALILFASSFYRIFVISIMPDTRWWLTCSGRNSTSWKPEASCRRRTFLCKSMQHLKTCKTTIHWWCNCCACTWCRFSMSNPKRKSTV